MAAEPQEIAVSWGFVFCGLFSQVWKLVVQGELIAR
jgi:hypothetical protein